MIFTAHKVISDTSIQQLQVQIDALLADNWQPIAGSLKYLDGYYHYEMVQGDAPADVGDISDAIAALQGRMDDAEAAVTLHGTNLGEIVTAFNALGTKLNADATAQNALADFPLTMDTDYEDGLTLST